MIADPAVLERLSPAKLVPAPDRGPGRFERGTPSFEALAGVAATVDWLAALEPGSGSRRERLLASMAAVEARLDALGDHARTGLNAIDGVRVLGSPARRTPTLSFTVAGHSPRAVAEALAAAGIAVWSGDNYAFELMGRYGLAGTGGAVRASFVLYNDEDDADRLLGAVAEIAA